MKPTIEQTILVHQRVGKALSMLEARMTDWQFGLHLLQVNL